MTSRDSMGSVIPRMGRISGAAMALTAVTVMLVLAGIAMSQTIVYKTPNPNGRGWSDGTQSGGYVKPDPNFKPARTPDGQPDIQGVWMQRTLPGGTGGMNSSLEPIPAELLPTGLKTGTRVVDPADGMVPYQPWARALTKDLYAHYIDTLATCLPTGIPRQMAYSDYEILQPPHEVVFVTEAVSTFRHVPLDGGPHVGKNLELYMGDSRGHWEGNTLVIDITNINDRTWMSVRGDFHSEQAHVIERLTPIDANTIQYEVTVEDPSVFTQKWKMAFPLFRRTGKKYELLEENCAEGNKSINSQIAAGRKLFTGLSDVKGNSH